MHSDRRPPGRSDRIRWLARVRYGRRLRARHRVTFHRPDLHSVTATTDDGRFFQFDNRTSMRKASLFIDAQKLQLYTHSLYLPNLVLLGFGDGEIMQVDTRMMSL